MSAVKYTDRVAAISRDPSEELSAREMEVAVRAALDSLSDSERALVEARFGLSEPSDDADPMTSTQRAQLRRALDRLRDALGHLDER